MTDLRQAAMLALEALEDERYVTKYTHIVDAITALRTALEQRAQEPVAWLKEDWTGGHLNYESVYAGAFAAFPVYKHPPAAQPEQEPVGEVLNERGEVDYISYVPPVGTRLYTAPPAAQWDKPSASFNEWWNGDYMPPANPFDEDSTAYWAWAGWQAAQRPWVGLTDEEIENLRKSFATRPAIAAIEAKLKEKNT